MYCGIESWIQRIIIPITTCLLQLLLRGNILQYHNSKSRVRGFSWTTPESVCYKFQTPEAYNWNHQAQNAKSRSIIAMWWTTTEQLKKLRGSRNLYNLQHHTQVIKAPSIHLHKPRHTILKLPPQTSPKQLLGVDEVEEGEVWGFGLGLGFGREWVDENAGFVLLLK